MDCLHYFALGISQGEGRPRARGAPAPKIIPNNVDFLIGKPLKNNPKVIPDTSTIYIYILLLIKQYLSFVVE